MSVKFGASTIVQNPIRSNIENNKRPHGLGRSAAGGFYRYSKGVPHKRLILRWNELRQIEKEALDAFFDSMDGPTTEFAYIDHQGVTFSSVVFTVDELPWEEIDDERASSSTFSLDGCDHPTTTREKAIYGIEIELEILS